MPAVKKFVQEIVKTPNTLIVSKKYDYYVKETEESWTIYRRWYESLPWHKYCTIKKEDIDNEDNWEYSKKGLEKLGDNFVI